MLRSVSQLVELSQLQAYTTYTLYVTACTLPGCTASPSISLTTSSDLPMNLQPATVDNVTSSSVQLTWTDPQLPNGPILRSAARWLVLITQAVAWVRRKAATVHFHLRHLLLLILKAGTHFAVPRRVEVCVNCVRT